VLIPYVLYPRKTKVLTPTPWLRWHDTGAGSYTVVVRGGGQEWKQEGVTGSEMLYPTDAPPLKPGVDYLLVVMDEDSGRSSTEDPCKGLGFGVLSDEGRAAVEARAAEIEALELDEPTRRFVLATYYAGQELQGEALVLLDELSGILDTPAVHLWRGDLLREMALSDEAAMAYQEALERAEALGDLESQARAQVGLARTLTDKDKVKQHYEQAIGLYEALGDKVQAKALRDEKGP
jgi:tetratricopeptide (TPR) repeat protein